jgi:hypothetical protein
MRPLLTSEVLYQLSYVGVCPGNQPFSAFSPAAVVVCRPTCGPALHRRGVEDWAESSGMASTLAVRCCSDSSPTGGCPHACGPRGHTCARSFCILVPHHSPIVPAKRSPAGRS